MFCGRILMFLARFFPLSERSGIQPWFLLNYKVSCLVIYCWCHIILAAVNIKGVFNTSNESKYEKDPPPPGGDGMSLLSNILAYFSVSLVKFLAQAYTLINFLAFPGISIDFNFYKTFRSLLVNFPILMHS